MPKEKPVPAKIKRLVHGMSSGQILCMGLIKNDEAGENKTYWLERSGKRVTPWTVQRALELGLIIPSNDGLFTETDSQTYRLANV